MISRSDAHRRLVDELLALFGGRAKTFRFLLSRGVPSIASREECHFGAATLTRAVLDHVPPIFGKNTFSQVANNYPGGAKSFKDTMHDLETAARKVADAHLHTPIRRSETLPVAQQVNFASQLDVLLSEIVRITR